MDRGLRAWTELSAASYIWRPRHQISCSAVCSTSVITSSAHPCPLAFAELSVVCRVSRFQKGLSLALEFVAVCRVHCSQNWALHTELITLCKAGCHVSSFLGFAEPGISCKFIKVCRTHSSLWSLLFAEPTLACRVLHWL